MFETTDSLNEIAEHVDAWLASKCDVTKADLSREDGYGSWETLSRAHRLPDELTRRISWY
jgi:hypothetical protein